MQETSDCQPPTANSKLIEMGVFSVPHGVRGQVKLHSFTQNPDDIANYSPLQDKDGKPYAITIEGQAGDMLIASVKGITSRNEAEKIKNITLFSPRSALPKLKKGEYYQEDLKGITVVTGEGQKFGTILSVHNFGAGTLVNIRLSNGSEEFMPFNPKTFPQVDVAKATAVIDPPFVMKDDKANE